MRVKWPVVRDGLSYLFGLAGIAYQTLTGNVNPYLLIVFGAMTGVPGITSLISLVRGLPTTQQSQPSVSPPPESRSSTESS